MAKGDIVSITYHRPTDEETDIATWTEEQETQSITALETGARQIISLVTALFGLVFGVLAFGADNFGTMLATPVGIIIGILLVLLFLLALWAALMVVMPRTNVYGEKRLDEMQAVYGKIIKHKSDWLEIALICFGLGLVAFAVLILLISLARF